MAYARDSHGRFARAPDVVRVQMIPIHVSRIEPSHDHICWLLVLAALCFGWAMGMLAP